MIKKLFGETEEEQFKYLQPRLFALGVGIVALLLGVLLMQIGVSFGNALFQMMKRAYCIPQWIPLRER